jgi:glycosyltransferase involved in cell wall biosynthesis
VICPTYNGADFVLDALNTVARQSEPPFELIVSDDGSTDGTIDLLERFRAEFSANFPTRIIRNPHGGPGVARNRGVLAAQGDWIAFLDSDDLWAPEKLARVREAIARHPESNFFCHNEEHRLLDGRVEILDYGATYNENAPLPPQLYMRNFFSTSAVICSRDLVLSAGMFDEDLMSAQDYELWLRMSPDLRPCFIRETLGAYIDRPGSITLGKRWRRSRNVLIVYLRHRRKGGWCRFFWVVARMLGIATRDAVVTTSGGGD